MSSALPEMPNAKGAKSPPAHASLLVRLLLLVIRAYQLLVSPLLGPSCRFHPSCSRYTAECLRIHGAAHGSYLGLRRILRCHPWNPGGYDPPPPLRAER